MPSSASYHAPRSSHSVPARRSSDLHHTVGTDQQVALPRLQLLVFGIVEVPQEDLVGQRQRPVQPAPHHREVPRHRRVDRSRHFRCRDRKSTRLNSSHANISYAVFCLIPCTPLFTLCPCTTLFRSTPHGRDGPAGSSSPAPAPGVRDRRGAPGGSCRPTSTACPTGAAPPRGSAPSSRRPQPPFPVSRSEEHTSELQSRQYLVCRLLPHTMHPALHTLSLHDALPIYTTRSGRTSR